jgi:beta-galactosidase
MLKKGSFNIYMFIGGTNFGFMNGANHYERYAPTVTSYDYDALLTECGDVTEKYRLVRRVMEEHLGRALPPIPKSREKRAYGEVRFPEQAGLLASLARLASPIFSEVPHPMEQYGQGYGYIAYKTTLSRDCENAPLSFESIGDRAHIFVNGTLTGILYINDEKLTVNVTAKAGDTLTVLVENMGRANFGSKMMRKKGIVGRVTLGQGIIHFGWQVYPLPMDDLSPLVFGTDTDEVCAFYRGHFTVDVAKDTFLYIEGAKKGFAVLNGFHLGRFWSIGPQKSLYVPASLLHEGENELLLFSSDGTEGEVAAEFTAYPTL